MYVLSGHGIDMGSGVCKVYVFVSESWGQGRHIAMDLCGQAINMESGRINKMYIISLHARTCFGLCCFVRRSGAGFGVWAAMLL